MRKKAGEGAADLSSTQGFTLAEVLITLAIIGIVAALTIPTLINNYQKKVTINKVKKDFALFSSAIKMAEVENGSFETWKLPSFTNKTENDKYFIDNYLKPYMKIQKICAPSSSECWKPSVSLSGISGYLNNNNTRVSFILANGESVYMWVSALNEHVQIWVNINGSNNNAVLGKDIFGMMFRLKPTNVNKSGFLFQGLGDIPEKTRNELLNNSLYGCSKEIKTINAGFYCGGLLQFDGFEIKDDYPW